MENINSSATYLHLQKNKDIEIEVIDNFKAFGIVQFRAKKKTAGNYKKEKDKPKGSSLDFTFYNKNVSIIFNNRKVNKQKEVFNGVNNLTKKFLDNLIKEYLLIMPNKNVKL